MILAMAGGTVSFWKPSYCRKPVCRIPAASPGERAGPPEDIGGPRGYTNFLRRKLRNGSLPSGDSQVFSADDINRALQRAFHRKSSKTATPSVIK